VNKKPQKFVMDNGVKKLRKVYKNDSDKTFENKTSVFIFRACLKPSKSLQQILLICVNLLRRK